MGGLATYSLPERQKNNELDGDDLEAWMVVCKVAFEPKVELNQTVHSNRHANSFNNHNLRPLAEDLILGK